MKARPLFAMATILAMAVGCSDSMESTVTAPDGNDMSLGRPSGPPPPPPVECETAAEVVLMAGQHYPAGFVSAASDGSSLQLNIVMNDDFALFESHVAVGAALDELPQTKRGNPRPGRFADKADHDAASGHSLSIDLSDLGLAAGDDLFIAVHTSVVRYDADGSAVQSETAWAEGDEFPGNNWAMYFRLTIGDCESGEGGYEEEETRGGGGE